MSSIVRKRLQGLDNAGSRDVERINRRDEVIQAAIEVLAIYGSRGFTHREIDRHSNRPLGSTSNYFRRRDDLLSAVGAYIMQLDLRDTSDMIDTLAPGAPVTIETIADLLVALFRRWSQAENRNRALARMEIIVESIRNAELRAATQRHIALAQQRFEWIFEQLGSKNPVLSAGIFFGLLASLNVQILSGDAFAPGLILKTLLRDWLTVSIDAVTENGQPAS